MHARAVGATLCFLLLLCGAVLPARGASQDLSSEEMMAARALRAERIPQAAAIIAEELQRRSVRLIEKKVLEADALRLARKLNDAQLEALVDRENDLMRVLTDQELAVARDEMRVAVAEAIGDPDSHLVFVPLAPCRVIDTRFAGGKLAPAEKRDFEVAGTDNFNTQGGNAGGCGVPLGASEPAAAAVVINFIAVDPDGAGHLVAWEAGQPEPFASIINYAKVGLNIANGVIVPIAGVSTVSKDLSIRAAVSAVHVVADVTGYFTRFPTEQFQGGLKSQLFPAASTILVELGDGGCKELVSCTVTAPANGTVLVEAWSQIVVGHTSGTDDRFVMQVETASPVTCPADDTIDASDYEIPAAVATNADVDFTLSHGRTFAISSGQTRTYRLSGKMFNGASSLDKVENARLICTFIPD